MREAIKILIGRHDFSAFRAAGGAPMSPIRNIFDADIFQSYSNELQIKIHAKGFLYHMARNIVGSLVAVGRGKFSVDNFKNIFESCDRNLAAPTAPPQGLCLYQVFYS